MYIKIFHYYMCYYNNCIQLFNHFSLNNESGVVESVQATRHSRPSQTSNINKNGAPVSV